MPVNVFSRIIRSRVLAGTWPGSDGGGGRNNVVTNTQKGQHKRGPTGRTFVYMGTYSVRNINENGRMAARTVVRVQ